MNAVREYKSGMTFDDQGIRSYEWTIIDGAHIGKKFNSCVITPRNKKTGEWGYGKESFSIDGVGDFPDVKSVIEHFNKK